MTDNAERITLEHLRQIRTEQSVKEVAARLGSLEALSARFYAELVSDRVKG